MRFDQDHLNRQIGLYLRQQNRNPRLAEAFSHGGGHCAGYTALWLYAMWLRKQARESDKPRDDLRWWVQTLSLLSQWDGKSPFSHAEQANIDRFINHVEYFQNSSFYSAVGQNQWHQSWQDSKGNEKHADKPFSITLPISRNKLAKLLQETLVYDDLNVIGSTAHDMGIVKEYDSKRRCPVYYLYDSNCKSGWKRYYNTFSLSCAIFNNFQYEAKANNIISLRCFSLADSKNAYPPPHRLLTKYTRANPNPYTTLYECVKMGDSTSFEHFFQKDGKRIEGSQLNELLSSALYHNHQTLAKRLMALGANPNRAVHLAIKEKEHQVIRHLISMGFDLNQTIEQSLQTGNLVELRSLISIGLNPSASILKAVGKKDINALLQLVLVKAPFTPSLALLLEKADIASLQLLKGMGIDPATAFENCLKEGRYDQIGILLKAGFSLHSTLQKSLDGGNHESFSYWLQYYPHAYDSKTMPDLLYRALTQKKYAMAHQLLTLGIDPAACFIRALDEKNHQCILTLLQVGFKPEPIIGALVAQSKLSQLSVLINLGFNFDRLLIANMMQGHYSRVYLLVAAGAKPEALVGDLVQRNNIQGLGKLKDMGIDCSYAYIAASFYQNTPLIRQLLNDGFDYNAALYHHIKTNDWVSCKRLLSLGVVYEDSALRIARECDERGLDTLKHCGASLSLILRHAKMMQDKKAYAFLTQYQSKTLRQPFSFFPKDAKPLPSVELINERLPTATLVKTVVAL